MTYLAAVFASALVLSLSAVGLYRLNIKTDAASEYAAEGIAEVLSKRGSTGTEDVYKRQSQNQRNAPFILPKKTISR